MTLEQCYALLNGNYAEAKQRLMTEKLMEKFLLKFPADPSMSELRAAAEAKNSEEAFRASHTLKGVAANLGFTGLQKDASELTEQLRGTGEQPDPKLLSKVEESYKTVIDAIEAYKSLMQ